MRDSLRCGLVVVTLATAAHGQATSSANDIARAIVLGQAYVSGNVYVAGFIDDERRPWPRRIEGVPLAESRRERITADFYRVVVQDSEEHYYFPQREADPADDDLFATIDKTALADRNLARYRASAGVDRSVSFVGWDVSLPVANISYRDHGQSRPLTDDERKEIAAAKAATPMNGECSTEPQFLDAAKIILTASIAKTSTSIRLSKYLTPGCAGHLSEFYVLDVLAPGEPPRRFEFSHYHGLL
jgi:hypothetical protein